MPLLEEARKISKRLITWADARDRRNPFGHGKTGTQLLRDAAEALAVERVRAERLERALDDLHGEVSRWVFLDAPNILGDESGDLAYWRDLAKRRAVWVEDATRRALSGASTPPEGE